MIVSTEFSFWSQEAGGCRLYGELDDRCSQFRQKDAESRKREWYDESEIASRGDANETNWWVS